MPDTPPPTPPIPPVPPAAPPPPPASTPPPIPPVVSPPAAPPQPPPARSPAVPGKKSPLPKILLVVFGLVLIIGVAVFTGLLSRVVPGLGAVTLTYWGLWESDEIIRPVLDEFEKTHPGIKVDYKFQSHIEYAERLKANLNQGKGPDVFRIHNTWTPMFGQYLSAVPSSVFSTADYEKTFYPVTRADFKVGNSYLAVPLEMDGIAMFVNDDLLNKAGLSVPQNWDQLRDSAIAMSVCASANSTCTSGGKIIVSGVALGSTQNVDHWEDIIATLLLQNGVTLTNLAASNQKPIEDVFDYFTSFASLYRLWDANLPSSTNSFAAGKVGIYFGPSWRVFDIQNLNPGLRFSVHPLPQLPVDPARGEKPVTYASYWAEAVNNKSAHQSQAWELIKYLTSPETMQKLYQRAQSPLRSFGEPYSRQDMAGQLQNEKFVAPFISQAPLAKSWYLASYTHDGQNGLNSKLSALFAERISGAGRVPTLAADVNTILSSYGIRVSQ